MPLPLPRARWTPLPPNFAAVTRIGAESVLPPRAVRRLERAFLALYASRAYPALSLCLRHRGEIIFNRSIGHAEGNGPDDPAEAPKRVLTPEDPVCLFSASKAVTAALTHWTAEQGLLDLDQRVSHYLPAFAAHGKGAVTVSDLLAHRGGIPWLDFPPEEKRVEALLDWDRCIERLCAARPTAPGKLAYHALSGGFLLGELIQRVTREPLQSVLDRVFRQPLGMRHFTYGLPADHRPTVARNYVAGDPVVFPLTLQLRKVLMAPIDEVIAASNEAAFMQAVIPAGNLYATAEELSRFFQMLLQGGRWEDQQVLQPKTVARLVRPRGGHSADRSLLIPMRYSEGLMLGGQHFSLFGRGNPQAYGHIGFMNIYGWADPDRQLSVGLLATGKTVLGRHWVPLLKLLSTINRLD